MSAEKQATKARYRAIAAERSAQNNLTKAQDEERKARLSESEARAVLQFFTKKVLVALRPKGYEGGMGKDATLRAAIDAAVPGIETAFKDQPTVEASIRDTLSEGYAFWASPSSRSDNSSA